jgi:hypothetical protein
MHYTDIALKAFIKEIGAENSDTVDKLTIKKKEVSEMEGEVRILKV